MPFSKCLRAKIYSNMNVYFDPLGCQTLLLKESDPLLFSLGSWTSIAIVSGNNMKPLMLYIFVKFHSDIPYSKGTTGQKPFF